MDLEAAIAYWHTTDHPEKWAHILQLYNKLLTVEYSPVIALNRTYALAKSDSIDQAIYEASKLDLKDYHLYYCLIAELYKMKKDFDLEIAHLEKALILAKKSIDKEIIHQKLNMANSMKN